MGMNKDPLKYQITIPTDMKGSEFVKIVMWCENNRPWHVDYIGDEYSLSNTTWSFDSIDTYIRFILKWM